MKYPKILKNLFKEAETAEDNYDIEEPDVEPKETDDKKENYDIEDNSSDMNMNNSNTGDDMNMDMSDPNQQYVANDPEEIGRVYELKKIYYRLIAIEEYLSSFSDDRLFTVRNYIAESLELFMLISQNIDSFKDNLDEIIVLYYKFIKVIYAVVKKFVEETGQDDEDDAKTLEKLKSIKNKTLNNIANKGVYQT